MVVSVMRGVCRVGDATNVRSIVVRIRTLSSHYLRPREIAAIRDLLDAAFGAGAGGFDDEDWRHALGGWHFLIDDDGVIVAHAAVVERELQTGGHRLATGYVEAVATLPSRKGRGHAARLMGAVEEHVDRAFELGALASAGTSLYARRGWMPWLGQTYVRIDGRLVRTPDDDDALYVRPTPSSPQLDRSAPISCDWRPGDPW
jgi:aminoglycoside 2'-N-acetyltransferase I